MRGGVLVGIAVAAVAAALAHSVRAAEAVPPSEIEVANVPPTSGHTPSLDRSSALKGAVPQSVRSLTIVLGGDLGLGGSGEPVHPDGALRHGERHGWSKLTAGLAPLIDGDLNFANLETVVTSRNDLSPVAKAFNFRTHPNGLRHLVGLGFNVISAANNHAVDYGEDGLWETMRHLSAAEDYGLNAWHGIGLERDDALRPAEITVKGARIAFSAIGIGGRELPRELKARRAGMLSYHGDFEEAVARLADVEADLRILSVHHGIERQVRPLSSDVRKLRDVAARAGGIDLVVGHHAHVALAVQEVGGNLVFYGLGNLLHQGMQDMGRFGLCNDYGLLARVHLSADADGRMRPRAVEAIPLTDMHLATRPMTAVEARVRVEALNHLAAGLDDDAAGATGVRFTTGADGRGLYCLAGAAGVPGHIGALCRDWQPAKSPAPHIARRVAAACGGDMLVARDRERGRLGASSLRRRSEPAWSLFQN